MWIEYLMLQNIETKYSSGVGFKLQPINLDHQTAVSELKDE